MFENLVNHNYDYNFVVIDFTDGTLCHNCSQSLEEGFAAAYRRFRLLRAENPDHYIELLNAKNEAVLLSTGG